MSFKEEYLIDVFISVVLFLLPYIMYKKSIVVRYLFKLYSIIEKYKKKVLSSLFIFAFAIGSTIYYKVYGLEIYQAAYYGLSQFMFDIKTPAELGFKDGEVSNFYYLIYFPAFIAAITSSLTILLLFFKEGIHKLYASYIVKNNSHIIVFGLGKKGISYIDSELDKSDNKHIIVIEKDPSNPNIKKYHEKYYKKEFAIRVGDASDTNLLKELNIENCEHIVLLAGKDTENIEIALAVSDVLNKLKEEGRKIAYKNTYMHLEDRDLHKFYREGGLFDDSSLLHIKMFSMAQNSARSLFLEHDIDGDSREYIDSDKSFGIVVVGNTNLALEVIGQACEIAHFPNENVMTIYCIDTNIAAFKRLIYHRYSNIEDILTIKLEFKKLNFKSRKFYEESFWKKDVTNVMLCHDDAQVNLDIASELADSTYLKSIKKGGMKTKIHIAVYENQKIAKSINQNQNQFKYFDVFAETFKMASRDIVIDENMETIAKCIHSAYAEKYDPDQVFNNEDIEKEWFKNKALTDRDSNRAQAYHLPIKVKALGLRIDRRTFDDVDFLMDNRRVLNSDYISLNKERKTIIQNNKLMPLDDESLEKKTKNYITIPNPENKYKNKQDSYKMAEQFDYFPETVDTLFEKLIRSEKNRWNAHHSLRGWSHSYKKNKDTKIHDCLVPLLNLPGSKGLLPRMKWQNTKIKSILEDYDIYYGMVNSKRYTVLYDIYSILYIPNFLAKIKQKLQRYSLRFGVTGHRTLDDISSIENVLKKEMCKLDKLYDMYGFIEIISPLADGADRLVAKVLMEDYSARLNVPLPFQTSLYEKSFLGESKEDLKKSQKEFNKLLKNAFNVNILRNVEEIKEDDTEKEQAIKEEHINNAYFNVGKHVVDECDILIALWNGKPAEGTGGTAYIVAYAKEKGKTVLHIDTTTLKVNKINFKGEE